MTSPPIGLEEYPRGKLSLETIISIMVGDMQRIRLYATSKYPFQIPQVIPENVWEANQALIKAGYTFNVIKDEDTIAQQTG